MKFRIPFTHGVHYIPKRHRRLQQATLLAETTVDIPETVAPGIPAFELGNSGMPTTGFPGWTRFRMVGNRPGRVWRLDEGGLFAEYCSVGDFADRIRVAQDNPFDAEDGEGNSALPFDGYRRITCLEDLTARHPLRYWNDTAGARKAALIAKRAADFRIIDETVAVAVGEPVLVVREANGRVDLLVTEDISHRRDGVVPKGDDRAGTRFRLDQFSAAKDFAERASLESGASLEVGAFLVTASAAGAFLPVEAEHVIGQASALDRWLACRELPPGVLAANLELRSELARCPPDHATWSLVDAMRSLAGAMRLSPPPLPSGTRLWNTEEQVLERAEEAVAAWLARSIGPDEWPETALPIAASAEHGITQILTTLGLRQAAMALEAPLETLQRARHSGSALLWVPAAEDLGRRSSAVVVVARDLDPLEWVGYRGNPIRATDPERVGYFLSENARLRDEQDMIAEIEL